MDFSEQSIAATSDAAVPEVSREAEDEGPDVNSGALRRGHWARMSLPPRLSYLDGFLQRSRNISGDQAGEASLDGENTTLPGSESDDPSGGSTGTAKEGQGHVDKSQGCHDEGEISQIHTVGGNQENHATSITLDPDDNIAACGSGDGGNVAIDAQVCLDEDGGEVFSHEVVVCDDGQQSQGDSMVVEAKVSISDEGNLEIVDAPSEKSEC